MKYSLDCSAVSAFRKHSLNALFLFDHVENVNQFSLRFFGSFSPGMAPWNSWCVGYERAVIIRAENYGIIVESLH